MNSLIASKFRGKLISIVAILGLLAFACDVSISATSTPSVTVGTTVFSAIRFGDPDKSIDVVFVPDDDYGDMSNLTNRQAFLDDVSNMIDQGFYQNNAIANNLLFFNFWFMTESGDVQPGTGICPSVTWPDLTDAAFAEVIVMLHSNPLRDCAWGNRVTSEPTSYRTVVHEASHAAIGLPDEYCCDGGYWELPPVLYSSETDCTSDPVNAAWRDCESFTADNGTVWWRSEDDNPDIMTCGGSIVCEYGPADWVIFEGVLAGLASTWSITDPDVFAPDPWDWP